MNNNFTIGESPITEPNTARLDFHQYNIYSRDWQSGYVMFDSTTGQFYIKPESANIESKLLDLLSKEKTDNKVIFGPKKNN